MIFDPLIPDYDQARGRSLSVINACNLYAIPIDPFSIIARTRNINVMTYSELCVKNGLSMQELSRELKSEDGAIVRQKGTERYILFYNDAQDNQGRVRFTICHELGHFFMRHHDQASTNELSRGLSRARYWRFEKEADEFAGTLLVPPPVYYALEVYFTSDPLVSTFFKVSYGCAKVRRDLYGKYKARIFAYSHYPEAAIRYQPFIDTFNDTYNCQTCKAKYLYQVKPVYCPVCGNGSVIKSISVYVHGGNDDMKYSEIPLDQNNRALICPVCDNEVIRDGDYCSVCGAVVANMCTGRYTDHFGRLVVECEQRLHEESRFCHVCGEESTFLRSGYLKPWKDEHAHKEIVTEFGWETPIGTNNVDF